ncbi:MAG TPA: TetR-like C-terminal domain-containing protein, partial [Pyrinomonadaceae bacterium]|nr:TetR-like C-terminal domain-containing protein [Pyrinomonadaceae bacterium]
APVLANYLASEVVGLLRWWLDHDTPHTPERMDEIFHALVARGFRAALAGRPEQVVGRRVEDHRDEHPQRPGDERDPVD